MDTNFNNKKVGNSNNIGFNGTKKSERGTNNKVSEIKNVEGNSLNFLGVQGRAILNMGGRVSFKGSEGEDYKLPELTDEEFERLKKEIEEKLGDFTDNPKAQTDKINLTKKNISLLNKFLGNSIIKEIFEEEYTEDEDISSGINYWLDDMELESDYKASVLNRALDLLESFDDKERAKIFFGQMIDLNIDSEYKAQVINKIFDNKALYTNENIMDHLERIAYSTQSQEQADLKCRLIDRIVSNEDFLNNDVAMEYAYKLIEHVASKPEEIVANKIIDDKNLYSNKNIMSNLFEITRSTEKDFQANFTNRLLDCKEYRESEKLISSLGGIKRWITSDEEADVKYEMISKVLSNKEIMEDDNAIGNAIKVINQSDTKPQAKVGMKIIENPIIMAILNNKHNSDQGILNHIFEISDTDEKANAMCNLIDKISSSPVLLQSEMMVNNLGYVLKENNSTEGIQAKTDLLDTIIENSELLQEENSSKNIGFLLYCTNSQAARKISEHVLKNRELLNKHMDISYFLYDIKTQAQAKLLNKIIDNYDRLCSNKTPGSVGTSMMGNIDTEEKIDAACNLIDRILNSEELSNNKDIMDNIFEMLSSEYKIQMATRILDTPELFENKSIMNNLTNILNSTVGQEAFTAKMEVIDKILENDHKLLENKNIKDGFGTIIKGIRSKAQKELAMLILENEKLYNNESIMRNLGSILNFYDSDEIIEAKAEIINKVLNNPELANNDNIIKNAGEIMLSAKTKNDVEDIYEFINKVKDNPNFSRISSKEILLGAQFIGLYEAENINEIPIGKKKEVLRKIVSSSTELFKTSDAFKNMFPLVPQNQDEYCELLPQLVKSIGIEGRDLSEEEIGEFNNSLVSLSDSLEKLSDPDFNNLEITQEYSRDEFISDTLDIVSNLEDGERQKVYDYFGFELKESEHTKSGYTIIGYPKNINNGEKLAQIEDENTKRVVEELRQKVIKFSENNNITVSGSSDIAKELNSIVKAFPELRTMIGKPQHKTHDFDLMKHSIKVIQGIVKDDNFKALSDSDKKLMIIAGLFHDITKAEGMVDKTHAKESAFDTSFLIERLGLSQDEEFKLNNLIKNHEWLSYANSGSDTEKRLMDVAYDFRFDNSFDMAMCFTKADLLAVKKNNNDSNNRFSHEYMKKALSFEPKIRENIEELKKSQPLLPVTKIPKASEIEKRITVVNADGSTNIKGVYKDKTGLVIIKFNEVENWEELGFPKGATSYGIKTSTSDGDIDTGNIHFFAHGLEYPNQLIKFDAFSLSDSDALLSVSYAERPESKYRFFRPQGVLLDADTKYIHGGGETDSGSGCGKNIQEFKNRYISENAERYGDRIFVSNLIKEALGMDDDGYTEFVKKNENKSFLDLEIEQEEDREKIIKALAKINSSERFGGREYNEMYISNPKPPMAVFAYEKERKEKIGNPIEFLNRTSTRTGFLQSYAHERDIPFILFGD